jgi:ATP-dependent Clp protease ATP-binding subunit ClpA
VTTPRIHPSLQLAWALANREAHFSGSATIEPLHFLVAILLIIDDCFLRDAEAMGLPNEAVDDIATLSAKTRKTIGVPQDRITTMRRELTKSLRQPDHVPEPTVLHRSDESRALFQEAVDHAKRQGDETVNMFHLLEALFRRMPVEKQAKPCDRLGTLIQELRAKVPPSKTESRPTRSGIGKTPLLDDLGRDLTALARSGRLPPVVGRKKEMTTLARHLQRTTKRNVLVIGEAGVGKTAIVEGFAQKIAGKEVPDFLLNLRIVQINVSDLVAGTHYRGDMESRVKRMIEEASTDPNLVLFLDEIHLAVKAGTGGGAPMDIASMLKPALSRDDFRCIGATTVDEFERHIKGDGALLRRFQIVRLAEPTAEEAIAVCTAWAHRVEQLQGVVFAEDAVTSAVGLSVEFIRGRALPDKAIDLLENAAVLVKVSSLSGRPVAPSKTPPTVTRAHVVAVIEEQYGISVRRENLLDARGISASLRQEIVGQDNAIEELTKEIESLSAGAEARPGPLGVFMFTGPTGTGKTFAGECLGRIMFPNASNAVGRFNMNEFKERHEIARLIGAPPGFIGHDQPGAIFRFAEANPQGLILLDEMEKAHPEIQDYFLQIFDKGEAQDSRGRKVDFRPYVFVMTCNVAVQATEKPRIGFAAGDAPQPEATGPGLHGPLSQHFRPEFMARVRRVVQFQQIGRKDYLTLLDRRFTALAGRMRQEHKAEIQITDRAKSQFAEFCTAQGDGCRGFDRLFDRLISSPVTNHVKDHDQPTATVLQEFSDGTPVLMTR